MSIYELPRNDNGDVNLYRVIEDILRCSPSAGQVAILEALIANAHKEEREACTLAVEGRSMFSMNNHAEYFANVIRNRE